MEFRIRLDEGESLRVDKYIASTGLFTRSQVHAQCVSVTDSKKRLLKYSRHLHDGDQIFLEWQTEPEESIKPEQLKLDIVYEDENVVVINKPQGMVVHPAPGHRHGTLAQGLMYRYGVDDFTADRAGIVHRLDKDTSGIMIASRNTRTHSFLSRQFQDRKVDKSYIAIIKGVPRQKQGKFTMPIGRDPLNRKKFTVNTRNARKAESHYRILEHTDSYSLVRVSPQTGRTHQIRVHLKSFGYPVLGDPLYSRKDNNFPEAMLMLHSWQIRINIPEKGLILFQAPISPHILATIRTLGFSPPTCNQV